SLLLGSVVSKILHDAQCPVWTATHTESPPVKQHLRCQYIMCAIDGSENSLPVLRWAAEFAKDAKATLRVIHVLPALDEWMGRTLHHEPREELRRQART